MTTLIETSTGSYNIKLDSSFDFESHKSFRDSIKNAMEASATYLSIDFDVVEYIDSSALGMLMLAKHETEQKGCKLEIINLHDGHAKNILHLVKFNEMFTIV